MDEETTKQPQEKADDCCEDKDGKCCGDCDCEADKK